MQIESNWSLSSQHWIKVVGLRPISFKRFAGLKLTLVKFTYPKATLGVSFFVPLFSLECHQKAVIGLKDCRNLVLRSHSVFDTPFPLAVGDLGTRLRLSFTPFLRLIHQQNQSRNQVLTCPWKKYPAGCLCLLWKTQVIANNVEKTSVSS